MNIPQLHEREAADALAALGNRTRLRIYRLLVRAGDEGLIVGEIQARLEIAASTLAHHLATLAKAGLVVQERQGRETLCRANYGQVDALIVYMTEQCCAGFAGEADENAA
ncbi:MAG TPA: metalloregulator ArsR/SmtB family transcription factor [Afifellaceae bacterium]|nr:metalloregulator ArsR/SmtB family transcription factor [Afifellaceae bacterium]